MYGAVNAFFWLNANKNVLCVCASFMAANKRRSLQWIIDVTIGYPKARPMDIQTWIFGYRPPTVTHVHYR